MSNTVLITDDDESVLALIKKIIVSNGMEAFTAKSGEECLRLIDSRSFDLLLLDINMEGIDGFSVISTLRARGNKIPIIVISGRKDNFDTIHGLELGADDYIVKPFNPVTLGAKAKALIRRGSQSFGQVLHVGPFSYDTAFLRLYRNGEEIQLTGKENAMMKLFLDNPNRIFTKELLYELVWENSLIDENAIMVYINRLRQKIEPDPSDPRYLKTVRGVGYRFVD